MVVKRNTVFETITDSGIVRRKEVKVTRHMDTTGTSVWVGSSFRFRILQKGVTQSSSSLSSSLYEGFQVFRGLGGGWRKGRDDEKRGERREGRRRLDILDGQSVTNFPKGGEVMSDRHLRSWHSRCVNNFVKEMYVLRSFKGVSSKVGPCDWQDLYKWNFLFSRIDESSLISRK